MPASTRSANKDANFRVYYSRKVPKQKYFPHRRATVRRPERGQHVPEKRQMTFLPEKMQRHVTAAVMKGKKRNSHFLHENTEEDEELAPPVSKRRRKSATPKRRQNAIEEREDEKFTASSESEQEGETKCKTGRQSTMTQIANGRRPAPGAKEPHFMPMKRSRSKWGGKDSKTKDKDGQQRTLTQMVPGLLSLGIMSDEDMEGDIKDIEMQEDEDYENADSIVQRLTEKTWLYPETGNYSGAGPSKLADVLSMALDDKLTGGSLQSLEEERDDEGHMSPAVEPRAQLEHFSDRVDEYRPTQHVNPPAAKKMLVSRRASNGQKKSQDLAGNPKPLVRTAAKPRFGLLATPEKRRVLEIPSSQSPPESPLSTQVTPQKVDRSPPKDRSMNDSKVTGTAPKQKKVTFQEKRQENILPPPTLRVFASTIPDSEDEGEGLSEDEEGVNGQTNGTKTQKLLHGADNRIASTSVGVGVRAVLPFIDHAYAFSKKDRGVSQELSEPFVNQHDEVWHELEEPVKAPRKQDETRAVGIDAPVYLTSHANIKQEPLEAPNLLTLASPSATYARQIPRVMYSRIKDTTTADGDLRLYSKLQKSTSQERTGPDSPPILSPMVIRRDPSKDEPTPTPLLLNTISHPEPTSYHHHQSSQGTYEHFIQVPRSPSPPGPETQPQSGRAERHHSKCQTYSQYYSTSPASSMHEAALEPEHSYQATPFPPQLPTQPQYSSHISQATTVDPTQPSSMTSPQGNLSRHVRSATTTPQKVFPSLQPLSSPDRPPPLQIPSSYPSPTKVLGSWGSIETGRTGCEKEHGHWGEDLSVEEFSIPPPPPFGSDDEDEEL